MMVDLTPLQENAVKLYIQGATKSDAYRQAGYDVSNSTDKTINEAASRLFSDSKVLARMSELKQELAEEFKYTVRDAVKELDEIVLLAKADNQFSPAVSAIGKKIDMFGLEAPKTVKLEGTIGEWLASLQNRGK